MSVHENEIVRQATHRRVVKSTQHAPWVRSLYYLRSDRLLMTQRLFTSNVLRYSHYCMRFLLETCMILVGAA